MTVYIVQEVRGRDISSASSYGNLEILLTSDKVMENYTVKQMDVFHNKLKNFSDRDFLLLSGDPVAIALASCIASANNNGRIKFLRWDRKMETYFKIGARVEEKPHERF